MRFIQQIYFNPLCQNQLKQLNFVLPGATQCLNLTFKIRNTFRCNYLYGLSFVIIQGGGARDLRISCVLRRSDTRETEAAAACNLTTYMRTDGIHPVQPAHDRRFQAVLSRLVLYFFLLQIFYVLAYYIIIVIVEYSFTLVFTEKKISAFVQKMVIFNFVLPIPIAYFTNVVQPSMT